MFVVLLGLPGAGKGTQAARLKDETGLAHITTGELFRENIRQGTELGKKAQPLVESGALVPDDITIGMLLDRMKSGDTSKGIMFDGFPRTTVQAEALDQALEAQGKQIDMAIYINVGQEELVSRLAGRWSCPKCSAIYHEKTQPPQKPGVCDKCGAELTQRADDRPDVVRTRLEVNLKNLQPLLDYYGGQGKLKEVDGERDADAITAEIKRLLSE
ncbi:MAG TPA: adenylate kinase [Dehalococcoidia bacterium]|nr:adenylate kinase [Dehalococcoidia bacterium]